MKQLPSYRLLSNSQSGYALLIAVVMLSIILASTVLIVGGASLFKQNAKSTVEGNKATNLAEAGIDKAIAALNKSAGYNGEGETELEDGSYSVTVTSVDSSTKKIIATGYLPNKSNPETTRTIELLVSKSGGASFSYGIQTGEGGLELLSGATVYGSVYSNGNIVMTGGARITGDAYVATGIQPDQTVDCTSPNCADYNFGKQTAGNNIYDIAQSFQPSSTASITKVFLKVKKVGWPSDATVRILGDNNGSPNKNDVKATGTLSTNRVSTSYGYIDVSLTTNPTLTANTTYWVMVDTSGNNYNYWAWSNDTLLSYSRGAPKWSPNWQAGSPVWNSITGDLGIITYSGGLPASITSTGGPTINGSAYASNITATNGTLTIGSHAYYKTISGAGSVYVNGNTCFSNNNCHPGSTDPAPVSLPITDANIQSWKDAAAAAGTYSSFNCSGAQTPTVAAGKYVGNFTLSGGCVATVSDPIWITGNFNISGGALMKLNSSYGANSGVFVVDGTITFSAGGRVQGSGTAGSYIMGVSTYDSRSNGLTAISLDGGTNTTILYSNYGIINMTAGSNLRELVGWKVLLSGGASVTYESGLANLNFVSSAGGSFTPVKGSYKVK